MTIRDRWARFRVLARKTRRRLSSYAHPIRARLQPRRFHAFCVSAPRSGTHSIAGLFAHHYRAAHEPDTDILMEAIRANSPSLGPWLVRRDRALWLEMESNNRLGSIPGLLARTFPAAQFVLVVRDCYSWLESYMSMQLARPTEAGTGARGTRDWQLGGERFAQRDEELALAERGLYTLDGYLSFWAESNARVLNEIPAHRLLTLRLDELDRRRSELTRFLGIPEHTLDPKPARLDRMARKTGLIFEIDRDYLEERVRQHCGGLMARFFPEIHRLEDAIAQW